MVQNNGEDAAMKDLKERKNITGPLVRKLRKRNGWTQQMMAKRLREAGWAKCTRSWLARIEAGEVVLRDLQLGYIQQALGEKFSAEFWSVVVAASGQAGSAGEKLIDKPECASCAASARVAEAAIP